MFRPLKKIFKSSNTLLTHKKNSLILKGPYGIINIEINFLVKCTQLSNALVLTPNQTFLTASFKSKLGCLEKSVSNSLKGVFKNHFLKLKFIGVGFKALFKRKVLVLRLGFSHKLFCKIPSQVTIKKTKKRPPIYKLSSSNYNLLRETVFLIRALKRPEAYKNKGIRILKEHLTKKQGKKSK